MSLRARLLAVTLVLVAAGLAVAGWAATRALESFLVDRVDQQIAAAQAPVLRDLTEATGSLPGPGGRRQTPLPIGSVAELRTADGTPVNVLNVRSEADDPAPELPARIGDGSSTRTLGGEGEYRILSIDLARVGGPGSTAQGRLVIAVPLGDVNDTLGRLVLIELAVGAATLVALAALALWLVRLGLAPLQRIERTAEEIAAGDLSRRIEDDDPRTEVGRLGRTLNAMLTQIEKAFAERRESERRLRRFVADASHELQTPLTSVRGYAELFRRGAADRPEDLEAAMSRIESEAARMGVLVDDLLLLARLDQGRPMEVAPVDLAAIAGDAVADARAVEPDRQIALEAPGPVVVQGDQGRLRQILGNLLTNARIHTPAAAAVTVRVRRQGAEAIVEVADRGPGLPPEHVDRVFERFFRADPSRARASGGTGLGLSIVAAIAEGHGGRAEVESTEGEGALFRIVLPVAGAPRPEPDLEQAAAGVRND